MLFVNLLLAYQLEQYDNIRFLKFVYQKPNFWIKGSKRQNIDWTNKMAILFSVSVLLFFGLNLWIAYLYGFFAVLSVVLAILFFPILIIISNILISPIDLILKKIIVFRVKLKLKKYPNIKVIGITGSYGKTSTKEYLQTILSSRFNVIATPGTHNTELGISNFILKNLDIDTQILILEMGAYLPGDIQKLCDITNLDIGIITGITEQHLERFGNLKNIIKTKFELTKNIKYGGLLVFDAENENIKHGFKLYENELKNLKQIGIGKIEVSYLPDLGGIEFGFNNINYKSKLLGKHNAKNLAIAITVAESLGMNEKDIQLGVFNVDFVPHRLELIKSNNGVYVLDDSFNGNIEGFRSTIDLLKNISIDGRKIYLTPGIVELGELSEKLHIEIGTLLSDVVDKILLIKNSTTEYIQKGLFENGFKSENIKIYDTALKAHEDLKNILQRGDLIVFQNDWTDNYL